MKMEKNEQFPEEVKDFMIGDGRNALLLKAAIPEAGIFVDSACCAGVTPEKHEAALETMRSCQILVV